MMPMKEDVKNMHYMFSIIEDKMGCEGYIYPTYNVMQKKLHVYSNSERKTFPITNPIKGAIPFASYKFVKNIVIRL